MNQAYSTNTRNSNQPNKENGTDALVDEFRKHGFIVVRDAFSRDLALACADVVKRELLTQGVDFDDATTWTKPVVRINCPYTQEFKEAGTSPKLHELYDLLLGQDQWIKKQGVGGTIPVRFPSDGDPGDAGWHIDGSYERDGEYWVNVHSGRRGLLALFLFSDITENDAPTEVIVGSHLDVPRVLNPYGKRGISSNDVGKSLPMSTFKRPHAFATGQAGDVYICHPFLVHRATYPHRGTLPRILAQPEVGIRGQFTLEDAKNACVVERTIIDSLERR